jgi:AAA+ superfamily predicted ATPase
MTTLSRGARVQADISALLRSRHSLLWVVTREEARVERALTEAAATAKLKTRFWDCATGLSSPEEGQIESMPDPSAILKKITDTPVRAVYVLRDFHKWLGDPFVLRSLRSLARKLQDVEPTQARAVVILTPSAEVPPELSGHATVIDFPLPDRSEVAALLDQALASLPDDIRAKAELTNGARDAAIDAAVGLSATEVENCYAKSLVTLRKIDPTAVAQEKKRVIAREKVLTWHDPDPRGLDAIGGLDNLKAWLTLRKTAFSAKAKAFGLEAPKGAMLVGIPGCGKSLTAKCIASAWGMPLLRLDMGALRSKWVGESEANIRKALQVAEAVAPCVLWMDEVEKSLDVGGAQGDGGVAKDGLGAILSWMQEKTGAVFVIATANDVSALPPELLRKGRFDEVFWVDLPTAVEREAILDAAIKQVGSRASTWAKSGNGTPIDIRSIAAATQDFTGAELAALVPDALFAAFADGERQLTTDDLLAAAKTVVPLAKTAEEKIAKLRDWAKGRARPASTPEAKSEGKGRKLDL